MIRVCIIFGLLAAVGYIAGCGPVEHVATGELPANLTPRERNFETLWMSARRTLRRYNFEVDRQDRREGLMTTKALQGSQMAEFWRKDGATWYTKRENSLQPIMRAVKIQVVPVEGTDKFDFTVQVAMARLNRMPPQLTSSSQLRGAHAEGQLPSLKYADLIRLDAEDDLPAAKAGNQYIQRHLDPDEMITPLGWDPDLAEDIARDIRAHAGLAWQERETPARVFPTPPAAPAPTAPPAEPPSDAPMEL